jgi:hypothetical protein
MTPAAVSVGCRDRMAGVTAVAIREGMNLHQSVMEAHRDLPRGEKHDPVPDLLTSSAYRYLCGETLQAID